MEAVGEEGLQYWLRWQVPVCALIFFLPAVIAAVLVYRINSAPLSYSQLWMPCWRKIHPRWLFVYRISAFIIMSLILLQLLAHRGLFNFYFYTQWTFTLVIIYFVLGTVISAHGCWLYAKHPIENEQRGAFLNADVEESSPTITFRRKKINGNIKLQSYHEQEENVIKAGFWGYLMQIIYQTCAGAVVLTDIVFWFIIVPFLTSEHFELNMLMGCMHTLNVAFLLLDTALNSLPFTWFRLAYFVLWSCLYVIFQWVLHACGFTWWPYPFLELATPWAPLWYFSLALVHIPCYGVYFLIAKAKYSVFPKWFPNAFIRFY